MSLFFEDLGNKGLVGKKGKQLPLNTARAVGCKACPLYDEDYAGCDMPSNGSDQPVIYFLGERPFEDETEQWTGAMADFVFEQLDYDPDELEESIIPNIRFNNIIRTPTDGDDIDIPPMAIECCRERIIKDIVETKPVIIIGFGPEVIRWFNFEKVNISAWRGRLTMVKVEDHICYFFVAQSPDWVQRNMFRDKKTGEKKPNEHSKMFKRDLNGIFDTILMNKLPPLDYHERDYEDGCRWTSGNRDDGELKKIIRWLDKLEKEEHIGLDLETSSLRPYEQDGLIGTVAVGTDEFTVAFPIHWPGCWTANQLKKLEARFKKFLLKSKNKIAHNLKFEQEWLGYFYGNEVIFDTEWSDTLAQAYILDNRLGMHNLDILILLNFGFNLKQLSKVNRADILSNALDQVLRYNALDTKWTYKLFMKQRERFEDEPALQYAYEHLVRTNGTLAYVQKNGCTPNIHENAKLDKEYSDKLEHLEAEAAKLEDVKRFRKRYRKPLSLTAPEDIKLYYKMRDETHLITNSSGKVTTDEAMLSSLTDDPLAALVLEHRGVAKKLGTYIRPFMEHIYPDGMIHTNFNPYQTATGRLSSNEPAMQNWPKRKGNDVRRMIHAPEGHWIVCSDYGQIEARIIAIASQDDHYLASLWENFDVHMFWAKRISETYPKVIGGSTFLDDPARLKKFRGDVKNQWVFPAFFGSSPYSISKSIGVPIEIVLELFEEFWEQFAGVRTWQSWIQKFYDRHGYVETLTGRRRPGPLSYNEMINAPIQGCLQGTSLVMTRDSGMVPISELVGQTEHVWTGRNWAPAIGLNRGPCQLATIKLESGLTINCDTRHKLKNDNQEWIDFENLKVGDLVALHDTAYKKHPEVKMGWAYIMGYATGHGTFYYRSDTNYPILQIKGGDKHLDEMYKIHDWVHSHHMVGKAFRCWMRPEVSGGHSLMFTGRKFAELWESFGNKPRQKSRERRIPAEVWTMDPSQRMSFIRGLQDADGQRTFNHHGDLHTPNKELLEEVQLLASSVNIDTRLKPVRKTNCWILTFRCTSHSRRRYPHHLMKRDLNNHGIFKLPTKHDDNELKAENVAYKRGTVNHPLAHRIYKRYLGFEEYEFYRYDKIESIEVLDQVEDTYTLSVDDPMHQFVADGVIHKNTAADICVDAMNRLARQGFPLILNIHDDITSCVPDDNLDASVMHIAEEMCNAPFPWINAPLVVEMTMGPNWCDQEVVGEFVSTEFKDVDNALVKIGDYRKQMGW